MSLLFAALLALPLSGQVVNEPAVWTMHYNACDVPIWPVGTKCDTDIVFILLDTPDKAVTHFFVSIQYAEPNETEHSLESLVVAKRAASCERCYPGAVVFRIPAGSKLLKVSTLALILSGQKTETLAPK